MEQKSTRKLILVVSCILVILIAASVAAYAIWKDSTTTPPADPTSSTLSENPLSKSITVKVVVDGVTTTFTYETDSENLRGVLEGNGLIKGDESAYGLFVTEVNGVVADSSLRQWWKFTKNGTNIITGVDDTIISDGETYEITLDTY